MKIFVFILCFVILNGMSSMRVTSHRTAKKCVLPKSQKINWNKIRGNWYEALNRKSPLEKLLSCEAWSHVVPTKYGIKLNLRNEDWKTHTYSVLPMFIRITKSGTGIWKPPTVKKWFASLKQSSANHNIGKKLIMELKSMQKAGFAFSTDYKTYFIVMSCGRNGEKYVWAHTRHPYPTAKSLVAIFNSLVKIGHGWNDEPLYLSQCVKISNI
uniref:uncharacterized protein LOC120332739 isoform X1 n=1 Tax=Styela clava TaxID=7725 RepID=UPI0019396F17|nr:uncharacterized protein LOC120332739 isoform X1 [Styela clava]